MIEQALQDYKEYWQVFIFAIIFVIAIINFIVNRLLLMLERRSKKTAIIWDDIFFEVIKRPVNFAIWVYGISYTARLITIVTGVNWTSTIKTLQAIAFIFFIIWILLRFIRKVKDRLSNSEYMIKPMDQTTAQIVCKLLQFSIVITGVLIVLQSLGYSISGVLAFGGVGGMAIGFAARDLLANFFGALMIYLDRPFNIGDWIRSPDKEIEGVVENIGWRSTKIRTFDQRPLYIPNSIFNQISVENPSRMTNRRIYEVIGIRYDDIDSMNNIVEQVKAYLRGNDEIDTEQTLMVSFDSFNDSSIDFFIYTFTKTVNWAHYHDVKHNVLLQIAEIIKQNNAEIAFPTRSIHLSSDKVSDSQTC